MDSKIYKRFAKISFIFVAVYAYMGIVVVPFIELSFINELLAPLRIFHAVLPFLAMLLCFSFPFFGPLAIGSLLIKLIMLIRHKPSDSKPYTKEIVLHLVYSLIGMAAIFAMYCDKFANPFR